MEESVALKKSYFLPGSDVQQQYHNDNQKLHTVGPFSGYDHFNSRLVCFAARVSSQGENIAA